MARAVLIAALLVLLAACTETRRCPDGEIFGEEGLCVPIPDGGPANDAGS